MVPNRGKLPVPRWLAISGSLLAVAAIMLLRRSPGVAIDQNVYSLLLLGVVVLAGGFGGVRAALIVLPFAGVAMVDRSNSFTHFALVSSQSDLVSVGTFITLAAVLSLLCGRLRDRRVAAETAAVSFESQVRLLRELLGKPGTAAALRATERHFQRLAAAMPQILWATDADGRLDYCNQRYYDSFGIVEAAMIDPGSLLATVHPDDRVRFRETWRDAQASREVTQIEYRLKVSGDGEHHWHHGRFLPVRDDGGRIERWFFASTDIEHQRQAEALARTNAALTEQIREREQAEIARRELAQQLAIAQEQERSRIARELHDQMGQYLTALGIGLRVVEGDVPEGSPAHVRLGQLKKMTEVLGRDVHRLAIELRPSALDDFGLRSALQNYVDEWAERSGVDVDYHESGLDEERLPGPIETAIYRVVQEALTNVLKHAEARRVSLVIRRTPDEARVVIEDNGRGFDPEAAAASGRLGLLGITERMAQVGGTLEVESEPGRGTTLLVRIPLDEKEREASDVEVASISGR